MLEHLAQKVKRLEHHLHSSAQLVPLLQPYRETYTAGKKQLDSYRKVLGSSILHCYFFLCHITHQVVWWDDMNHTRPTLRTVMTPVYIVLSHLRTPR